MNDKHDKTKMFIFLGIVFVFTYIFFTRIHKLVIFDADDWTYISEPRKFIPVWGAWNPIKLFPETLMSLCGSVATYLINPFINNYVKSITITTSFVVSSSVTLYIYTFLTLIKNKYKHSLNTTICISLLFYLFHFLLFIVEEADNQYLFWAHNVNCYYNYLIPNLLNFSLIFYLLSHEFDYSIKFPKNFKYGVLLLLIYITIFSNMYCNIILGVFAGTEIIIHFVKEKKKIKIIDFIKKYFILFIILLLWIISVIFESSGGRAASFSNGSFIKNLFQCLKNIWIMIRYGMNRNILCLLIIVFVSFIIIIFKNKKKREDKSIYNKFIIYILIVFIYFMLLSAKVKPEYVLRAEDMFPLYVFSLTFIFICLSYLIKKYPKITIVFPIFICFYALQLNANLNSFREGNTSNINPNICEKISSDLLNQVKAADENGLHEVELHVPEFYSETNDNWPLATYLGERMSRTLYTHKIINKKIDINIVIDKEKNIEFQIYN